jgi:chromosome segregation ATPase
LDRATSRGDQAVLAATRCTATLEQARHRIAQLEERLQETRTALTATQAALRDRDEALRAKEEALARLEDLHSSHSQQLDKEAACCQSSLQARGRLEERTRRCELQLGRMEQQLEQARATQQAAAAAAAARATQQQLERAAARAEHRQHVNTWAWGRPYK